jgi:NitT/TauT family transport system permease protein
LRHARPETEPTADPAAGGFTLSRTAGILIAAAGVLLVWWLLTATGWVSPHDLPSPATVWSTLWHGITDGTIPTAVSRTLIRLVFGMAVAAVFGTLIGVGMAASRNFQRTVGALVAGLQALPPIAWLPLAALWFGFSERAVVFVVIVGAFPSIAMATAASIRQVSPLLVRAGRTLGAEGWELYRHVVVPAAVPGYVEGLRQGWVFAWRSLLAAELIIQGGKGLGHSLTSAGASLDAATILSLMIVIVVIGILIDAGFAALDRKVRSRRGLLVAP